MAELADSAFYVGNFLVDPEASTISGASGASTITPARLRVLAALAVRPGESVPLDELAEAAGVGRDAISVELRSLREVLGDNGQNPRFLLIDDGTATLIAPVRSLSERQIEQLASESEADISFFQQLQRRKVIRVGAGYILLAWVAIQVSDVVMPALGLPDWTITLTIGLAMAGFPVALVFAWLYETTSVGTFRDKRRVPAKLSRNQKVVDITVLSTLAVVAGFFAFTVLTDVQKTMDRESLLTARSSIIAAANSVAVLPFRTIGGNPDNAYVGDGIAEETLRLLSRLKELNVAARTASFYFKDKDVALETMAQRLKVRHVLTGSVQIVGDAIRVNAELADASTGKAIWSESFDREMLDIFAIQSEIARAVADQSGEVLSADSNAALDYRPTSNPEAYDYYLRGRDYLRQPRTVDVLENAERLFHRAMAIDPNYALAMAGLCETHLAMYIRTRSTATVDDAESICRAAIEVDPSLPEVHTALGYLYWHTGDFDRAESEFRIAIDKEAKFYEAYSGLGDTLLSKNELDAALLMYQQLVNLQPAYWAGYRKLGYFYYRQGRDAEALPHFREVTELTPDNAPGWNNLGAVNYMLGNFEGAANAYQRALEIAPTQVVYANLGTMYYYFGRYADSVEMQKKSIELAPDDYRAWGRLAAAYLQMAGHGAEANAAYSQGIALAKEILKINPNEFDALKNIALFYARTGNRELAEASIAAAFELSQQDPDTHFFAALSYLALGDAERSIAELERAVALGYSRKLIKSEPAFAELRDNNRFKVLLVDPADLSASGN